MWVSYNYFKSISTRVITSKQDTQLNGMKSWKYTKKPLLEFILKGNNS
jgi:hypothetical protein